MVCRMDCRLLAFPASLRILVTLSTLRILAILGKISRAYPPSIPIHPNSMTKSKREALTTKKSNLFQLATK